MGVECFPEEDCYLSCVNECIGEGGDELLCEDVCWERCPKICVGVGE